MIEINTLNCSSEQIRTLCDVNVVDGVCVEFSEGIIVIEGIFDVEGTDSIIGIPEPCPID